ncbi:meiosis-specific nuclear structural protein 1-like [Chelonus insularis]|uniref:meiosis-specific nuclear structural protein 1-like n=1 Tax=Chelonus insularis TaxID=460826 RepID=UPI00158940DA|nr:meiosis-specific nuclear structural protein 1-like [Chelonus insularis]
MASDNKMRQIHRRNCLQETFDDEIVELERAFRNAYILKSLEAQLAEKEANRVAHEAQERLCLQLMALKQKKIMEKEKYEYLESRKQSHEMYKKYLQKQMEMKKEKLEQEKEVAKRNRKILEEVDELMDKIHDFSKQKQRELLQAKLRREKLIFDEIREIKKVIAEEKEILEAEREMIFLEQKVQSIEKAKEYHENLVKSRQALIDKVAKLFMDMTIEKCKREAVIANLLAEEINQEILIIQKQDKEWIKEKKDKERQLANDLMDQIRLSVECEARAREQDRIFFEKVMGKVMEDKSMAILTLEARKRKQVQYKEDLEKLILERKKIREDALKRMRQEVNDYQEVEETRRNQIKEGRRRLIEQHAKNIVGYLKESIFTNEEVEIVKQLLDKCRKI